MPTNKFFTQTDCDRCGGNLKSSTRTMSWFTEDTLCMVCFEKEVYLKNQLLRNNIDIQKLEGCGYLPAIT